MPSHLWSPVTARTRSVVRERRFEVPGPGFIEVRASSVKRPGKHDDGERRRLQYLQNNLLRFSGPCTCSVSYFFDLPTPT